MLRPSLRVCYRKLEQHNARRQRNKAARRASSAAAGTVRGNGCAGPGPSPSTSHLGLEMAPCGSVGSTKLEGAAWQVAMQQSQQGQQHQLAAEQQSAVQQIMLVQQSILQRHQPQPAVQPQLLQVLLVPTRPAAAALPLPMQPLQVAAPQQSDGGAPTAAAVEDVFGAAQVRKL